MNWKLIESIISVIMILGFSTFAVLIVGSIMGMPKSVGLPVLFWTTGIMLVACGVGIAGVKLDPYYRR
jgi:hypothetical protein